MTRPGDIDLFSSARPVASLYLARAVLGVRPRYSLRQTYLDNTSGVLRHREIFDLGNNPQHFITYPGDSGYQISENLIETVEPFVDDDAGSLLEELLWPFIRRDIRAKLEPFRNRGRAPIITRVTSEQQAAIAREIHLFDRRRLHYLWYGAIDQSGLFRMPDKLCRKLLGRSRDEKEQFFIDREIVFQADQVKEYLFAVFNLQRHFSESFARVMPQGLNQEQLDSFFVEELCRLNNDAGFWQGMEAGEGLQHYLIRYLIMFFDYDFGASQALNDYIRQFMNSHRQFRFPERKKTMDMDKVSEIFGESAEKLGAMNDRELTRLYRKRAKDLHPDTGGGHDEFVRLKEAFEQLLRRR